MRKVLHIGDEMEINKEREAFEIKFKSSDRSALDYLKYHNITNKYVISNDIDRYQMSEAQDCAHIVNVAWQMWQAAKATPEGFVLVPKEVLNKSRRVVTLTCSELLEAFQFGAPDGEGDEDQMATEMTIEWLEEGHSGKGYYAYYSELPEEGAIKLGEENDNENSN